MKSDAICEPQRNYGASKLDSIFLKSETGFPSYYAQFISHSAIVNARCGEWRISRMRRPLAAKVGAVCEPQSNLAWSISLFVTAAENGAKSGGKMPQTRATAP